MSQSLRLAMVGCGDIAGAYLTGAQKAARCRIVQVMDVNAPLAQQRGAEFSVPWAADYEAVLANPEVDAVILSVPHFLHAPMTIQALERGKHVMCDKPIATTIADGRRMIEAAARTGRKFTINYPMRSSDKHRYARQLIAEGVFGNVFAITIVTCGHKPEDYWQQGWSKITKTDWRKSKQKAGGGVTLMNASHFIDLALSITGLAATAVRGFSGTFNSPPDVEVEDLGSGSARLSNGGILTVLASSCYTGDLTRHISILGTKGQTELFAGAADKLPVFLRDASGRDIPTAQWTELPVPASGRPQGYSDLMEDFAAAVFDGAPVPVPPEDALHTLAIVLGIYGEAAELPPGYAAR